jgi:2-amino-4-hydroxy-6-hydroxymethyldihydropteridine diphosphokinase
VGSNQPFEDIQPFELVEQTLAHVGKLGGGKLLRITGTSRWYRSPAFPAGSGPDYVNGVISVVTELSPEALLEGLHSIETELGRQRNTRWGARTLDLDLIDFAGRIVPDLDHYRIWAEASPRKQQTEAPDRLILPHPRMQDRAFVLVPLRDVAPDWHHPVSGLSVDALIAALPPEDVAVLRIL